MSGIDAVDLLEGLLREPSPTGDVDGARDVLVGALEDADLAPWVDTAGNVRAEAGSGSTTVLLCGHVDTVPGGPDPRRTDGWVWGRGSVDAKGPLAVLASALPRLRDAPDLHLRFAAVPDEEGSSAGARFLAGDLGDVDAVVVGEPNHARGFALGYRGNVRLQALARADPRHPATPHPTAADRLHAWWADVRSWCGGHEGTSLFETASPKLLELGTERGSRRERARLEATVRTPPGFPTDAFLARLREADDVQVEVHGVEEPVEVDPRGPLASAFRAAVRDRGRAPRPTRKTGTCDLNVLVPGLDAPGVAYGPGDPRLDHTPDERVRVAEVREAEDVLVDALARFPAHLARAGVPSRGTA